MPLQHPACPMEALLMVGIWSPCFLALPVTWAEEEGRDHSSLFSVGAQSPGMMPGVSQVHNKYWLSACLANGPHMENA